VKRLIATTALALTLATPAFSATDNAKQFTTVEKAEPGDLHASKLIGMRVYATEKDLTGKPDQTEWDDIGEVDDIILTDKGKVKAVILGVGGFLGIGERDIAVDMSSLNMVRESDDADDFFLVVNTNKDTLMNAPAYDRPSVAARKAKTEKSETAMKESKPKADDTAMKDPKPKADETAMKETKPGAEKTQMAAKDPANTGAKLTRPTVKRDGYSEVKAKDVSTDKLKGATVYGANDEEVGEVDRLLMNDDDRLDGVVVDVGGFLGVGERPVAFDVDELLILRQDDGDDVLVFVDSTKSALKDKPKYQG